MQEEQQPIGQLFQSISFYKSEDVLKFLQELTTQQAMYVLTQACMMAHSKGIYTLQESEFLSKAIRLVSEQIYSQTETQTEQ